MPRLILRGDTIKNLGEYLPIPNIEKIQIYDDNFVVRLSLMLTVEDDEDEETLLERLSGLRTYLLLEPKKSVYEAAFFEREEIEDGWDNPLTPLLFAYSFGSSNTHIAQIELSEYESTGEYLYDTSGNKILKMIVDIDQTSVWGTDLGGEMIENIADGSVTDIGLFVWTSTVDFYTEIDEMFIYNDDFTKILNGVVLDQIVSDVSYEIIFEDGEVAGQAEVIWANTNGDPFDGIPLQSLHAQYYTPDGITHKEITESFNDLLAEYATAAAEDDVLESVVDGVSYVLAVYGTEPDLVPRLNELRKAWPDKSSTTGAGHLYRRYKRKLFNANLGVAKGVLLHKELVLNPKIIDLREPVLEEYDPGLWAPGVLTGSSYGDSDLIYPKWYMQSTAVTSEDAPSFEYVEEGGYEADYINTSGFFFFDFEKLIYSASNLANVLNISKIHDYFGKTFLNDLLTVDSVYLTRMDEDETTLGYMYGSYKSSGIMNQTFVIADSEKMAASLDLMDGTTEKSYLVQRNFAFPDEEYDTYRLMTFEFQDIYSSPYSSTEQLSFIETSIGPSDQIYKVEIEVTDNTLDAVGALSASYSSFMTGALQEYYDAAAEHCSYNNTDGVFNEFFIAAITTAYADDPGEAPWIQGPVIYNLHRDLLFDTFEGDYAQIIDTSKKMSDRISPYAGNLERLEAFLERFNNLYNTMYTDDGSINVAYQYFLWHGSETISKSYSLEYSQPWPIIYNSTLEDYLEDQELGAAAEAAATLEADWDLAVEAFYQTQADGDVMEKMLKDVWFDGLEGVAANADNADERDDAAAALTTTGGSEGSGHWPFEVGYGTLNLSMWMYGVNSIYSLIYENTDTDFSDNRQARVSYGFAVYIFYWYHITYIDLMVEHGYYDSNASLFGEFGVALERINTSLITGTMADNNWEIDPGSWDWAGLWTDLDSLLDDLKEVEWSDIPDPGEDEKTSYLYDGSVAPGTTGYPEWFLLDHPEGAP